jgi:hypothetical protein
MEETGIKTEQAGKINCCIFNRSERFITYSVTGNAIETGHQITGEKGFLGRMRVKSTTNPAI